jgi:predicted metal-binding protein
LTRIESNAFSYSSLQSIVIPRNVQFIDGSAFIDVNLSSISIESGNDILVIEDDFLIDGFHHKLIRNVSKLSEIEIGRSIEILGSKCFSDCKSLSSITFESQSLLTQIESEAFAKSSLQSILIPRNVEILGSKCFSYCKSLSSITFESNSHLTRIESNVFSDSSLQSIVIPRNVGFIDGSAFSNALCLSVSIESGNDIFIMANEFLIDIIHHKLIRNVSKSSEIEISNSIEIRGSNCFSCCKSLSSITFESNSQLTRIESFAFL